MDLVKIVYWLEMVLFCCDGVGVFDGEFDMEDGVIVVELMEGEFVWGSDGGDVMEDFGVGVLDGEGEIICFFLFMNGVGEGDWVIVEVIIR